MSKGKKILIGVAGSFVVLAAAAAIAFVVIISLDPDPNELAIGAAAPSSTVKLLGTDGQPFALDAAIGDRLPVLVFYRGHW